MSYDYLVVGSGLFGAVFARMAAERGKKVHIIDKRKHIAGNCYTSKMEGIEVHHYGPHIFHTDNDNVWHFLNRFSDFNHYRHHVKVNHDWNIYSFPINMMTLSQIWGVTTPQQAENKLASVRKPCKNLKNLREWCIAQVGEELYKLFVEGYTTKQWGRDPSHLPASIIRRLPIRLTYNDCYFNDRFQGIPTNGYTRMFENMLDDKNITVETGVDYLENKKEFTGKVIYTGKIDEYYDYRYGELEYRSLRFDTRVMDGDYQGVAQMNYTSSKIPFTRVVEHKHFALQQHPKTVVTFEYPQEHNRTNEPFYPVRDDANIQLYNRYAAIANDDVIFGGRLGGYKYTDMDITVAWAMKIANDELLKK